MGAGVRQGLRQLRAGGGGGEGRGGAVPLDPRPSQGRCVRARWTGGQRGEAEGRQASPQEGGAASRGHRPGRRSQGSPPLPGPQFQVSRRVRWLSQVSLHGPVPWGHVRRPRPLWLLCNTHGWAGGSEGGWLSGQVDAPESISFRRFLFPRSRAGQTTPGLMIYTNRHCRTRDFCLLPPRGPRACASLTHPLGSGRVPPPPPPSMRSSPPSGCAGLND